MNDKDNAVKFYEYMCNEDCAFSTVKGKLGEFSAVLFYLRGFENWLKARGKTETKMEK